MSTTVGAGAVLQQLKAALDQLGITAQVGEAAINATFFDPTNPKMTNNDELLAAALLGGQATSEQLISLAFAPPSAQLESQIQTQAFAGLNAKTFHVQTEPGVSLQAWYIKPEPGKSTILFSNGTDGNFIKSKELITQLKSEGYGILTYQFRGYGSGQGGSTGVTSEQGLYSDLKAMSRLLAQGSSQFGIQKTAYSHQVLMGYSLGGDVSAHVAAQSGNRYQGLVLVDAPKSIEDAFKAQSQDTDLLVQQITAPFQSNILAAEQKIHGAFDITKDVASLHVPTLFVQGENDKLALPELAKQLFQSEKFPIKSYVNVSGADHNTVVTDPANAHLIADRFDQFLSHSDYCKVLQDMSSYNAHNEGGMSHFSQASRQPDPMTLAMAGHH
jgi:pimeloyl-ACP methyl ester carboxylesterase